MNGQLMFVSVIVDVAIIKGWASRLHVISDSYPFASKFDAVFDTMLSEVSRMNLRKTVHHQLIVS